MQNIRRSHSEYIKKYNSRPNLFFVGEKFFHQTLLPSIYMDEDVRIKTNPELRLPTVFGCAIVFVDAHWFGYGYFEYEDLEKHKSVKTDLEIFQVYKQNENHKPAYAAYSPRPLEESQPKILEIPVCVLDSFNRAHLVEAAVNRMHNSYWEYVGMSRIHD